MLVCAFANTRPICSLMRILVRLLCLFITAGGIGALRAQSNTAVLGGRVLDSSGATIASASLSLVQKHTGLKRDGKSDGNGEFLFPLLPPGEYQLSARHDGFKSEQREGIIVSAGDRNRIEVTLAPGAITETVSVVADAPQTNADSSTLGFVANSTEVQALPLASRNFDQLITLGAGIVRSRPGTLPSFSINGTSQYGYNLSLDGTDASAIESPTTGDPSAGSSARLNVVSPESIEQLQVQTGSFSADSGRASGALINIISRTGTNTFHGSLFEYFRNDKLDARNFFATSITPLRQNQFGGSLGGPVIKNRLFFFGNYEASRARTPQFITANVPTAAFRAKAPSFYDTYLNAVPLPTQPLANNTDAGIYTRTDVFKADENLGNVRGDYTEGPNSVSLRYTLNKSETSTPTFLPPNRLTFPLTNDLVSAGYTRVLGPSTVNELRLGLDRWDLPRRNSTFAGGLGGITITGILTGTNTEGILHWVDSTYTLADTLHHRVGNHSLRAGGEFRRVDSARTQRANPQVAYTSAAAFLADTPSTVTITYGNLGTGLRQWQTGLFVQDDWRLHPRLTLNLGLRYDYFTPLAELHGRMQNTGDNPYGPFLPRGTPLYNPDKNNFQPRIGFAWDVSGRQKTIIRGGFGIYNIALPPFFIWSASTIDPALPVAATYTPVDYPGLAYPLSGALAAANRDPISALQAGLVPAVVSRFVIDRNRRDPYTMTWNFTAERQLMQNLVLQGSYVGTRTLKSQGSEALNLIDPVSKLRPAPGIGQISYSDSSNRRMYDALQFSVRKRYSHGLVMNANYTWSHVIIYGNEDSFGPSAVQDFSNIASSRGTSALDVRHVFVVDHTWQIPTGSRITNNWSRHILRGWSLSGITALRSGLPANILTGRDNRGNGFANTQRPNYLGGSIYATNQNYLNWFNPAAFANPLSGSFGNLGYDAANGPMSFNMDIALARRFTLWHEQSLQFRADAFNIENRVNFNNPDTNINSPTFGRITSAAAPRQIQLSLRYQF
jgi:Carboxypeptidase regulatory-like domain/TonB dependent receptor